MFATRYLPFVSRPMISLAFTMIGMSKFAAYAAMTGRPVPSDCRFRRFPVVAELGAGVLIAGYRVRVVAIT
jgi:hypothetical protein